MSPLWNLHLPKLFNLRQDTFERADEISNTYWDCPLDHLPALYAAQALTAQQLASFGEFPPRQNQASFNLDSLLEKMLVLLVVLLLLASTIQVAFAAPPGPVLPSCHMGASWWAPDPDTGDDTGPGNAYGVKSGERGMYNVHNGHPKGKYTNGATNMDLITTAHCGG